MAGRKELIDRIRKHPLTRMLRVGKLTDMALEQTLRLFRDPASLAEKHPLYRMLPSDQIDVEFIPVSASASIKAYSSEISRK